MNSRAWALAAMTCALLIGTPSTLADEAEDQAITPLTPGYLFDEEDLENDCTSMLRATFVSFGGTVYETDIGEETNIAYVEGEHRLTVTTITEYVRLITDAFGLQDQEILDTVESSETVVEATTVDGVLLTEWERDLVVWERIERTVAVPLPAEGTVSYGSSDVISSCDEDEDFSIEFPVYGGEYDMVWGTWYYEPYAPNTPEPEWMYEYINHEFTEGVEDGVEYDEYRHGHCACPQEVEAATEDYVANLHPVVEDAITEVHTIFVEDEDADSSDEEATSEGSQEEQSEGFSLMSLQATPIAASASAGGVGLAGLLGSAMMLRRR
jgi:hypothetical protein